MSSRIETPSFDGEYLWAKFFDADAVVSIDPATRTELRTVEVGRGLASRSSWMGRCG